MNTQFKKHYDHTWRVMEGLVRDFDPEAWVHTGRGVTTPARLSFHILKSTQYYIEDSSPVVFASGRSFENNCGTAPEDELPSQRDILACISEFKGKTDAWLSAMNVEAENKSFDWAGKTKADVVLFLSRHSLFHIGELSSLLNESKHGEAEDNFVKAL